MRKKGKKKAKNKRKKKNKGGSGQQGSPVVNAASTTDNSIPARPPLPVPPESRESLIKQVFTWDGFSFVFFTGVAVSLLGADRYSESRFLFMLAGMALAVSVVTSIKTTLYPRLVVALLAPILVGIGVNRVNDWVSSIEIAKRERAAANTTFIIREVHDSGEAPRHVPSQLSTEPADRANLHVVNVRFASAVPTQRALDLWAKLKPALRADEMRFAAVNIPPPEAHVSIRNIGKYKTKNSYWVRMAIVVSPQLFSPREEDALFKQAKWHDGGLINDGTDVWYPGDEKIVTARYGGFVEPSDWIEILEGDKGFYLLTRSIFADLKGPLPDTESCTYWSLHNRVQTFRF